MLNDLLYAERDIEALDEKGNYYCAHVSAMTSEGLHSKSAIAAELAYRDARIKELEEVLNGFVTDHCDREGPEDDPAPANEQSCGWVSAAMELLGV